MRQASIRTVNPGICGHSMRKPRLALLFLCVSMPFLGGCGEDGGDSVRISIDQTTDTTVLSINGMWGKGWPVFQISRIDTLLPPESTEPALGDIASVAVSGRGDVAVLDGMAREVWVLDRSEGTWVRSAVQGEGPAELGSASGAWWAGDTLFVLDARRSRLLLLTEGRSASEPGVPLPGSREGGVLRVWPGAGGGFLVLLTAHPDPLQPEGTQRPGLALVRIHRTSEGMTQPDTIGRWPGRTWMIPPGVGIGLQPFGPDTFVDAVPWGFALADASFPQVSVFGFSGEMGTIIRWEGEVENLSREIPEFLERCLETVPEESRPGARALLETLPYPRSLPHIGSLLMGEASVWISKWFPTDVERCDHPRSETEWRIVSTGNTPRVHRITLPAGVIPFEILPPDSALVLLEDALGRQGIGVAHFSEDQNREG